MQYIIAFLEGIITFISPCLLPMLPVYISYFAGGAEHNTKKVIKNALAFILGFTVVFVALGALTGCAEPAQGPLVPAQILPVLPPELLHEVVHQPVVKVLSTQVSVSSRGLHLKDTSVDGED